MALAAVGLQTQIFNNHIKSALLLMGFPVLLLLMLGTFLGMLEAFAQPNVLSKGAKIDWPAVVDAGVKGVMTYGHYAILAALVWFVIAYFFHGQMMRRATGAFPITRKEYPKIYNVLENLCISRGITMPQFEMIDSPALNAFATGIDDKTYKIVLTRGIIEHLQDDELEAVIAHELSHVMNRDVRLLIISVIFVGIISFLCEAVFRALVHGRPRNYGRNDKNNGALPIMLLALAILVVGYIFAIVIRFALSRRREYLADAGAVDLTKNPEAMMRALLRISGKDKIEGMPDEVQQMCIENSHSFMGVFATHPSIDDRVKMLSFMTGAAIPALPVSLRRIPTEPWKKA